MRCRSPKIRFNLSRSPLVMLGLVATLWLCGCGLSEVEKYYPLGAGYNWTYETTYDDPEFPPKRSTDMIVERKWNDYHFDNGLVLSKTHLGLLTREAYYLLQGPLRVGHKWGAGHIEVEITAVNKRVTVPAGVFDDCLTTEFRAVRQGVTFITLTDYCRDVGPAAYELYRQEPGNERRMLQRSVLLAFGYGEDLKQ